MKPRIFSIEATVTRGDETPKVSSTLHQNNLSNDPQTALGHLPCLKTWRPISPWMDAKSPSTFWNSPERWFRRKLRCVSGLYCFAMRIMHLCTMADGCSFWVACPGYVCIFCRKHVDELKPPVAIEKVLSTWPWNTRNCLAKWYFPL